MKKVIVRFYDKVNFGDDLFLKLLSDRYKNEIQIVSNRQSHFEEMDISIPYNKIQIIILKCIGKLAKIPNFPLVMASRNNILVYIGGSIFIEEGSIKPWERELNFYKSLRSPYFIIGSNFGPYRTKKFIDIVKKIISNSSDTCFRDYESYNVFKDLSTARVSTDAVLSLKNLPTSQSTIKTATISVIDCTDRFDESIAGNYEKEIAKLADKLTLEGYQVVLASLCKLEGDEEAALRIIKKMNKSSQRLVSTHFYAGNINKTLQQFSNSDIIVGTRFHSIIIGLLMNKKVIPIAYSDKTLNLLKDFNFSGRTFDVRDSHSFNFDNLDVESIKIHNASRHIEMAEDQFKALDRVLVLKNE